MASFIYGIYKENELKETSSPGQPKKDHPFVAAFKKWTELCNKLASESEHLNKVIKLATSILDMVGKFAEDVVLFLMGSLKGA